MIKYQAWINYGLEGWNFDEFDTFEEAYEYAIKNNYSKEFKITKTVKYSAQEELED